MRNLSLTILSVLMLSGCEPKKEPTLKKPFVIIGTGLWNSQYNYELQDANGYRKFFSDKPYKYSIGDTIK